MGERYRQVQAGRVPYEDGVARCGLFEAQAIAGKKPLQFIQCEEPYLFRLINIIRLFDPPDAPPDLPGYGPGRSDEGGYKGSMHGGRCLKEDGIGFGHASVSNSARLRGSQIQLACCSRQELRR